MNYLVSGSNQQVFSHKFRSLNTRPPVVRAGEETRARKSKQVFVLLHNSLRDVSMMYPSGKTSGLVIYISIDHHYAGLNLEKTNLHHFLDRKYTPGVG